MTGMGEGEGRDGATRPRRQGSRGEEGWDGRICNEMDNEEESAMVDGRSDGKTRGRRVRAGDARGITFMLDCSTKVVPRGITLKL